MSPGVHKIGSGGSLVARSSVIAELGPNMGAHGSCLEDVPCVSAPDWFGSLMARIASRHRAIGSRPPDLLAKTQSQKEKTCPKPGLLSAKQTSWRSWWTPPLVGHPEEKDLPDTPGSEASDSGHDWPERVASARSVGRDLSSESLPWLSLFSTRPLAMRGTEATGAGALPLPLRARQLPDFAARTCACARAAALADGQHLIVSRRLSVGLVRGLVASEHRAARRAWTLRSCMFAAVPGPSVAHELVTRLRHMPLPVGWPSLS